MTVSFGGEGAEKAETKEQLYRGGSWGSWAEALAIDLGAAGSWLYLPVQPSPITLLPRHRYEPAATLSIVQGRAVKGLG